MEMKEKKKETRKAREEVRIRWTSLFALAALVILIVLSNINLVSAIGITPGRINMNFESGMQQVVYLKVVNNEFKNMNVELNVSGELAQYVKLNQSSITFNEDEPEKEFYYTVTLPASLGKPGLHQANIIATDVPLGNPADSANGEGSQVSAVIGVASQLYVHVPYPGAYLEGNFEISEAAGLSENTSFILQLSNMGTDNVNAKADIEIIKENKIIEKIQTDEKLIESGKRGELVVIWQAKEEGSYIARATVYYAGKKVVLEKPFEVGQTELLLRQIYVKDYNPEQISRVIIVVENKWNEQLKNIYGHLIVTKENGDFVSEFKSAAIDLDSGTTEGIYAYWDNVGIKFGNYTGKIIMHYNDKSFEKQFRLRKTQDSMEFEIIGVTGGAISELGGKKFNINPLLIVLIAALILLNLVWLIYFKKRKQLEKTRKGAIKKEK